MSSLVTTTATTLIKPIKRRPDHRRRRRLMLGSLKNLDRLYFQATLIFLHRSKNWAKKKLPKKLKCSLGLFSDFYFAKNLKFMSDEFYAPSSVRERAADSGMGF